MPPCCLPNQVEPPHCVLQGPEFYSCSLASSCSGSHPVFPTNILLLRFSSWTFFFCHVFSLIEILFFKVFSILLPQTSLFQIFSITSLHAGAISLSFHNLAFSFITWYFTCGCNLAPSPPTQKSHESAINYFSLPSYKLPEGRDNTFSFIFTSISL